MAKRTKTTQKSGDVTIVSEGPEEDALNLANVEKDSPVTDAGQVHPVAGNPAPVTQEGRDIRDGSQHVQALLTILGRPSGSLSAIQEQKLKSHPAMKKLIDRVGKGSGTDLVQAMKDAQSDPERAVIVREALATVADPESAIRLLREPEDPNADPVRDRTAPDYRVAPELEKAARG